MAGFDAPVRYQSLTILLLMYCILNTRYNLLYGPFTSSSEAKKWAKSRFGSVNWTIFLVNDPENQSKKRY